MPENPPVKRGRPAFTPTAEQRRIVEEMKFVGETDTVIARALSIDPATLQKHFADELADGHAHCRKEVVGLLFTAARKGNVAAQKKLEELGRIAGAVEAVKARKPKSEKMSKKAERLANAEAATSAGKYAVPSAPRLVVNN